MLSFECDYSTGAHPEILKRFGELNMEPAPGYGEDPWCAGAREKIRKACGCPDVQVEFLTGGTQTNAMVIASMLHDYEGVVAATTGHVSVHEAGAIEYTGHKVLELPQEQGKMSASVLEAYLHELQGDENAEHMVYAGMVYISHPTEYGTLYSKAELEALSAVCRRYSIPLYMDGARLGYGLMSSHTDITLQDITRLCDVFSIGGTKVGALCGEAVVFTHGNRPLHFVNFIKRRGALLAKGRLLGIQFDTLFTDDLYFTISRHAIRMAEKMVEILKEAGIPFFLESPTNQQFVVLENSFKEKLDCKVRTSYWEKPDQDHTVVRFATSWSTTEEDLEQLRSVLAGM